MPQKDVFIKLSESVADFYETYGTAFSYTRAFGWRWMKMIHDVLHPGMTLLDVGAGNSRLGSGLPEGVRYIAIEPSSSLRRDAMTRLAGQKDVEILEGGFPSLPVGVAVADVTACIAVIHHIPTREAQRAAIHELARVTKTDGTAFVTAWNLRRREMFRTKTWLASWLRFTMVKGGEPGDVWIPWKSEVKAAQRFVHAFTMNEFASLFDPKEWTIIQKENNRNLLVVAKRR